MNNAQKKIEIPGLNTDSALMLCDGDVNIYLHSLRLYVSNMPATLEKMRHVSQEKLHDYAISAHAAKGISEYVGAEEVKKTAKQLEAMAKDGDLAGILAQNEAFIKYAGNIVNDIKNWLEKNNA